MTHNRIRALRVTITAPVVSFRDPLYRGIQVGLPCPPPSTVAGLLAAAAGGWDRVDERTRFALAFHARGVGVDLETYHPLVASGPNASPAPRTREFLADVELTVWLSEDIDRWHARLRRPVWPLRLGRSQDLVGLSVDTVELSTGPGTQRGALVPHTAAAAGTLLRLPTAVSVARDRTRWDSYRFDPTGKADNQVVDSWSTADGQAVVLLPPTHPQRVTEGVPE
ncbi:CRISPR-associated protein Cas5 [Actinokineospora cianjurensis]|uniref:CRISPR-associated protein Cas5t n=1 Tax=Actinokineospora cianjurensis TaxID=585224 RepID=A0A421B259_9PSEU|nr:CRISPR-associated protein Cas5 [Actinokineospora cianjurensis]RLK58376.1 CRISPR-associated protein Cas5t [Actinokineospora cianjurensis]